MDQAVVELVRLVVMTCGVVAVQAVANRRKQAAEARKEDASTEAIQVDSALKVGEAWERSHEKLADRLDKVEAALAECHEREQRLLGRIRRAQTTADRAVKLAEGLEPEIAVPEALLPEKRGARRRVLPNGSGA